tara:strand:- start:24097 stop:25758 length:1662 start_codon:yes stop_codon:yes gene_type:complete
MAKTIGKFAVNIGAVTTGFSKGLSRAKGATGKFSSGLKGMVGPLLAIGAAFAAVKKTFGAFSKQFEAVDSIAKFSAETGIATQSLVGYRHAAALTGTSVETVDKGMQRFVRRLGEAKMGHGEAVKGFKAMGVSAEELASKTPEALFADVAEHLKNIKDPAERAAIAYSLFGRQGQEMLNFLSQGKEGLAAASAEADALGMSFSAVDAQAVEKSNDAWQRVKTAITGVVRTLTIHMAPAFEAVSNTFTEVAKTVIARIKEWSPVFNQFVNFAIALWDHLTEGVSIAFQSITGIVGGAMGNAKDVVLDTLIAMEWRLKNIGPVALLAFKNAQVGIVAFGAEVQHFFAGTLPALLNWFQKNWTDIWMTAIHFVDNAIGNLVENIKRLFTALWTFLAGGEWEMTFVPITKGFQNMIQELPQIPEREMGPLETKLRKEADDLSASLDADFEKFRTKRRDELLGVGEKPVFEMPELNLGQVKGEGDKKKETKEAGGIAALQRGSAATFSAIAKQIRGASKDKVVKDNAEANKKTAEAAERTADAVENLTPPRLIAAPIG